MRLRGRHILLVSIAISFPHSATGSRSPGSVADSTGVRLFRAGKLEEARTVFAPAARGDDAQAAYFLGRIAMRQNQLASAVEWFEKATRREPGNASYHRWLGRAYGETAQHVNFFKKPVLASRSRIQFERAVELAPDDLEARADLARFYVIAPGFMGGGVDKARQQVAEIQKRSAYHGALAQAAMAEHEKDVAAAEKGYRALVQSYPDSSAAVVRLALLLQDAKRWDDAFTVLETRLERASDDRSVLYHLGRCGALCGQRLERAAWALQRFLAMPPVEGVRTSSVHFRLGMVYEKQGKADLARREYQSAVEIDPDLSGAKEALAKLK